MLTTVRGFARVFLLSGLPAVTQLSAQTAAQLDVQTYAGLKITGTTGVVYSIEYITDLAQTNDPTAWRCLEFLQLPASPYLWADKSATATSKRFYRAKEFPPPTNMVFIPPGTFRMGSPTNELDHWINEGPQTDVTISRGFWMGRYEVTQGEFLTVMGSNPSYFRWTNSSNEDLSLPVETVAWIDATNYCGQRTLRERESRRIRVGCEYRLPTEAEWEYACRAWTSTRFSYGDDVGYSNLTDYAWFRENSNGTTQSVGQKLPNPWGLYDMHGNVHEWCLDGYGQYAGGIALDPLFPPTPLGKVVRGGSWYLRFTDARFFRAAFRGADYPDFKAKSIGFRVVLSPGPP
jgi:formylglycine-generating enzyme required for sulfatase activity